jgi:hypothetical protein
MVGERLGVGLVAAVTRAMAAFAVWASSSLKVAKQATVD